MHKNIDGKKIKISPKMAKTLNDMEQLRKGGFATARGYVSTSKRITPEKANIQFISKFSYMNLIEKKLNIIKELSFNDIDIKEEKILQLSEKEQRELFKSCINKMTESIEKTKSGDRRDSYRAAHDTFYAKSSSGVKIHLKTTKNGKKTSLITDNKGFPIADSIMVSAIEIGRKVIQKGEFKKVNSGLKVLMDNTINKALKSKGVKNIKTFSLKENNFDSLIIDKIEIKPDDI